MRINTEMNCDQCGNVAVDVCPRCQKPVCSSHQDEVDGVCDTCSYEAGEMEDRWDRHQERVSAMAYDDGYLPRNEYE